MRVALRWLVLVATLIFPASGGAEPAQAPAILGVTVEAGAVSLDAREVPLRDVLQAIAARADLELSIHGESDRRVTLRLDGVLLEEAIRRLVRWNYVLTDRRLMVHLLPHEPRETRAATIGAAAEPASVSSTREVPAASPEAAIAPRGIRSPAPDTGSLVDTGARASVVKRQPGQAPQFTGTVSPAAPASFQAPPPRRQSPAPEPGGPGPGTSVGVSAAEAARLAAAIQLEASDPEPDSLPDEVEAAPTPTLRP
jgi:hypothetical protein